MPPFFRWEWKTLQKYGSVYVRRPNNLASYLKILFVTPSSVPPQQTKPRWWQLIFLNTSTPEEKWFNLTTVYSHIFSKKTGWRNKTPNQKNKKTARPEVFLASFIKFGMAAWRSCLNPRFGREHFFFSEIFSKGRWEFSIIGKNGWKNPLEWGQP